MNNSRNSHAAAPTALLMMCLCLTIHLQGQTGADLQRYDIIISEIMADPSPAVGLPPVEYVEIHNRLPHAVRLNNWTLKVGNTLKKLPEIEMDSAGYVTLIAEKHLEVFRSVTPHVAVVSSLSLTDGGQTLILYNSCQEVVHSVSYRPSWHEEKIKQEGGWSLEIIDPSLPCLEWGNWFSSTDPSGGTPSAPNSVNASLTDDKRPEIERITLLDSLTIRLFFTEPVQADLSADAPLFVFSPPAVAVASVQETPPAFDALDIVMEHGIDGDILYSLSVAGKICDCAGNGVSKGDAVSFGIPRAPQSRDLVINEILTHPLQETDADYIEVYNRSPHIIDLKDVKIGSGGDTMPLKAVTAVPGGAQLLPGHYFALCKNRRITGQQYVCLDPKALWQCDSLPSYAISEGVVHLTGRALRCIDRLAYNEDMHYPQLLTTEGVSLERLRFDSHTQDADNWRSAAATAGFGTPGYQNSQTGAEIENEDFTVSPEVFSPDNDGYHDFTEMAAAFQESENRLTITVYNEQGFPVRHVADNVLCGRNTLLRWDGLDDRNNRLPPGFYVVLFKWWNMQGKVRSCKRAVAITAARPKQ